MCLDLYVHWVSRSMHLTELKQSDWVISALIINEFEKSLSNMFSYLYQTCLRIFINHVFISLSNMFSYLYQTCLQIFIGNSNIRFRIFTCIFTIYGYITNSQSNQIPDGLIAQLVEHCTGIPEVMASNPVQV